MESSSQSPPLVPQLRKTADVPYRLREGVAVLIDALGKPVAG